MSSVYSLSGAASSAQSWANGASVLRPASAGDSVVTSPVADNPKDTSTIPTLSKVEELKGTNPSQFQSVVFDAVTQLKVAARQTTDPFAASFLWNLANRFELALDSGEGSQQGTAASTAAGGSEAA
jgi:hypothetical protein